MQNTIRSLARILRGSGKLAFAAIIAALPASAQVSSEDLVQCTNLPSPVAANSGVVSNNLILLTRDCDLSLAGQFWVTNTGFVATNSGGSYTVTVAGSFSLDQTNFGLFPFTLTGTATTNFLTQPITLWTNYSHNAIAGFTAVNVYAFTNACTNSSLFGILKANRPTINTATY